MVPGVKVGARGRFPILFPWGRVPWVKLGTFGSPGEGFSQQGGPFGPWAGAPGLGKPGGAPP